MSGAKRWIIPWALAFIGVAGAGVMIVFLVKPAGDAQPGVSNPDSDSYLTVHTTPEDGVRRRLWPGNTVARGQTIEVSYTSSASSAVVLAAFSDGIAVPINDVLAYQPGTDIRVVDVKAKGEFVRLFLVTSDRRLDGLELTAAAKQLPSDTAPLPVPKGASVWSTFIAVQ